MQCRRRMHKRRPRSLRCLGVHPAAYDAERRMRTGRAGSVPDLRESREPRRLPLPRRSVAAFRIGYRDNLDATRRRGHVHNTQLQLHSTRNRKIPHRIRSHRRHPGWSLFRADVKQTRAGDANVGIDPIREETSLRYVRESEAIVSGRQGTIEVRSADGLLKTVSATDGAVSVADLPTGIYVATFTADDGTSSTLKFLKQ